MENLLDVGALINAPPPILLSAVIWVVLQATKQLPGFPAHHLPFLSFLLGAVGYPTMVGWTGTAAMQGLLIGGLPVASDQFFRQREKAKQAKQASQDTPATLLLWIAITLTLACFLATQGCATTSPPVGPVATHVSRATAPEAASAVAACAQLQTRAAVQSDPSRATAMAAAADAVARMASESRVGVESLREALAGTDVALADAQRIYELWSPGRSEDESAKVLASLAQGIRKGLSD